MSALVLCWCLFTEAAPSAGAPVREHTVYLLESETDYKARKETERVFTGVLEPNTGAEKERVHPYRLRGRDTNGGENRILLYAPGKAHLLERRTGQQVRITGKVVTTTSDGRSYRELWPARLIEMTNPLTRGPGKDGVYARCPWQPAEARRRGLRFFVYRDGKQLATALNLTGATADQTAAVMLARQLGVPEIDWKKYMLVTVCAGLRTDAHTLTITTVAKVADGSLQVSYRLPPARGGGFGYPAETVLVRRHEGSVRLGRPQTTNTPGK